MEPANTRLQESIKAMLLKYNSKQYDKTRNDAQNDAAERCSKKDTPVLQGPAGVGKTKISLEWALKTRATKLLYIAPRVQICQSLFKELKEELGNASIQLFTGAFKEDENGVISEDIADKKFLTSDVCITTIDQITSLINDHRKAHLILKIKEFHVVFDEFHEIIKTPAMAFYLKEFIRKRHDINKNNLLMSATPHPKLCDWLIYKYQSSDVVKISSFNNKKIQFVLADGYQSKVNGQKQPHPFINMAGVSNSFYISNVISVAQKGYLGHENEWNKSLVVHSGYCKNDLKIIMDFVFDNFGKNKKPISYEFLRTGPILQASLNISTKNIHTDIASPDDILQRLGRCNRFAEFDDDEANFTIHNTSKFGCTTAFLKFNHCGESAKEFFEYLKNKKTNKFSATLDEIYDLYFDFYSKNINNCVDNDFDKFEKEGRSDLEHNDFYEPIDYFTAKTKKQDKLANKTMRGASIFVIPTVSEWKNNQWTKLKYLYDPKNILNEIKTLSMDQFDFKLNKDKDQHDTDSVISLFKKTIKTKSKQYYGETIYNKYNTKNNYHIFNRAKYAKYGVFVGELAGEFGYNANSNCYDFTYIFDNSQNIYVGLIDFKDL